jgi:hypothetical protein
MTAYHKPYPWPIESSSSSFSRILLYLFILFCTLASKKLYSSYYALPARVAKERRNFSFRFISSVLCSFSRCQLFMTSDGLSLLECRLVVQYLVTFTAFCGPTRQPVRDWRRALICDRYFIGLSAKWTLSCLPESGPRITGRSSDTKISLYNINRWIWVEETRLVRSKFKQSVGRKFTTHHSQPLVNLCLLLLLLLLFAGAHVPSECITHCT